MNKPGRKHVRANQLEQLETRTMLHGGMHGDFAGERFGSFAFDRPEPTRFRSESVYISTMSRDTLNGPAGIDPRGFDSRSFDPRGSGDPHTEYFAVPFVELRTPPTTIIVIVAPPVVTPVTVEPPTYSPPVTPSSSSSSSSLPLGNLLQNNPPAGGSVAASRDSLARIVPSQISPPIVAAHSSSDARVPNSPAATPLTQFISLLSRPNASTSSSIGTEGETDFSVQSEIKPESLPSTPRKPVSVKEALASDSQQGQVATNDQDSDELLDLTTDEDSERLKRRAFESTSSLLDAESTEFTLRKVADSHRLTPRLQPTVWSLEDYGAAPLAEHPDLIETLAADRWSDDSRSASADVVVSSWGHAATNRLEASLGSPSPVELLDLPGDAVAVGLTEAAPVIPSTPAQAVAIAAPAAPSLPTRAGK